jgi:hypothetical protein
MTAAFDLRTVFLSLHVAGGVAGLVLGIFALRPPADDSRTGLGVRRAYLASLAMLTLFLVALVVEDWSGQNAATRAIFGGLTALAFLVLARAVLALRAEQQRPPSWRSVYMNHVYFTYISLWEGLLIVGFLDLSAPPWLVGVVAVGLVFVGARLFHRFERRVLAPPAAPSWEHP